jgi:hypothetical protein
MTDKPEDIPKSRSVYPLLGRIVLIVLIIWVVYALTLLHSGYNLAECGQFGDMFGAVNALFSGLALAGVIVAILLQKEELALQRKELKDTREEMQRSTKAQNESQKALNKQVDLQILSAKISALSACLDSYNVLIDEHQKMLDKGYEKGVSPFAENRRAAVVELEALLVRLKEESAK